MGPHFLKVKDIEKGDQKNIQGNSESISVEKKKDNNVSIHKIKKKIAQKKKSAVLVTQEQI